MPKLIFLLAAILFFVSEGQAQKVLDKAWDAASIRKLEIISDEIYHITVLSKETDDIRIITVVEGEHYENVVLNTSFLKGTRTITIGYTPYFEPPNDKLAAHKVISIKMVIHVPSRMEVAVKGALASVETTGVLSQLSLALEEGSILLNAFEGDAELKTKSGNITVHAKQSVQGFGKSKRGTVQNTLNEKGKFVVWAKSVNGDISLLLDPE